MGFEGNCVVIKFHDGEKYAAQICGGKKQECLEKAAYYRGLYFDVKEVKFGVYPQWMVDAYVDTERKGGPSLYEMLKQNGN